MRLPPGEAIVTLLRILFTAVPTSDMVVDRARSSLFDSPDSQVGGSRANFDSLHR